MLPRTIHLHDQLRVLSAVRIAPKVTSLAKPCCPRFEDNLDGISALHGGRPDSGSFCTALPLSRILKFPLGTIVLDESIDSSLSRTNRSVFRKVGFTAAHQKACLPAPPGLKILTEKKKRKKRWPLSTANEEKAGPDESIGHCARAQEAASSVEMNWTLSLTAPPLPPMPLGHRHPLLPPHRKVSMSYQESISIRDDQADCDTVAGPNRAMRKVHEAYRDATTIRSGRAEQATRNKTDKRHSLERPLKCTAAVLAYRFQITAFYLIEFDPIQIQ